ncbi:protein FAM227A [Patella vulgata]|uniref:protein FAM227A n=1 Tax=Patella vulgata TaxID=6465 RepID=UPI0024A7A7DF|nr:protein FAM227A [Patella vulgata]
MADINRAGTPMDVCDEGLTETQGSINQRKRELQEKQRTRSPFLIGSIDEVSRRIGKLDRQLQKYTQLVCESRLSDYSASQDEIPVSSRDRDRYIKKEKENREVLKFAGYYTLKTSFVPGLSNRAKNISKISMNPSKTTLTKNKDTGKPKFVELQQYPGFDKLELTPLPADMDAVDMLLIVSQATMALHRKPRYKPEFERLFYSKMSQAIVQDIFWWFFLEKFQPGTTAQPKLFNRIAHNYVKLLVYCKIKVYKETFFKDYPLLMAQAVYVSFCHAFPDSYRQFGVDFKDELLMLISQWMAGVRPAPRMWTSWNFDKLDPPNIKSRDEILPQNNKKSSPALNLDYLDTLMARQLSHGGSVTSLSQAGSKSSISWGTNKVMGRNQQNRCHTTNNQHPPSPKCQSPISSVDFTIDAVDKAQTSPRRQGILLQKSSGEPRKLDPLTPIQEITCEGEDISEKTKMSYLSSSLSKDLLSRHQYESHPACKGPDYIKASFNVFGQSPLVAHFLRMKQLSTVSGVNVRVQRTELENLPSYPCLHSLHYGIIFHNFWFPFYFFGWSGLNGLTHALSIIRFVIEPGAMVAKWVRR